MQSKSLLIAIAAFAVTTSGVFAYSGTNVLERANLSVEQKTAITRAREFKENGNIDAARDSLVDAGIDEGVLRRLHQARHQVELEMQAALVSGDYDGFIASIAETPLADIIITEADFEQFRAAQELKDEGDYVEAGQMFAELGVALEQPRHGQGKKDFLHDLSATQKAAFAVAKQANDKTTMQTILAEAGITKPVAGA